MTKKISIFSLLFIANIFSYPAGSLDPSFDGDGIVVTQVDPTVSVINAIAIQPDGKIIAVGQADDLPAFAIARYNVDGSLDTSFGTNGIVFATFPGVDRANAFDVKIDQNLKIVVTGFVDALGTTDVGTIRLLPNGSFDPTFGSGGIVITNSGGTDLDFANGLAIQNDGKIVVTGSTILSSFTGANILTIRYLPDGTLDSSFGGDGIVITDLSPGFGDGSSDLVIQPDGKIVVVGTAAGSFAILRFNTDGTLDTSFGTNGVVIRAVGTTNSLNAVTLQPDGKIVAVGTSDGSLTVVRLNTDGSFDSTFGTNGIVLITDGTTFVGTGIQVQRDGKIVVGGTITDGGLAKFGLARLNTNGTLDQSFGNGGIVITQIGTSANPNDLELQRDGKIVLGGFSNLLGTNQFTLARYTVCPGIESQSLIAAAIAAKFELV